MHSFPRYRSKHKLHRQLLRAPGRADAGQLPWSGGCAENDRSASIDTNHKRLWTGLAEEAPDTGQSATGRYRNEYGIHFAVHLMIDFRPRAGVVGAWIGRVRVLVGPDIFVRYMA